MEKKEFTAEDFLKGLNNFTETCGSCRFFNSTTNECREKEVVVTNETSKCNKWRYFA